MTTPSIVSSPTRLGLVYVDGHPYLQSFMKLKCVICYKKLYVGHGIPTEDTHWKRILLQKILDHNKVCKHNDGLTDIPFEEG